MNSRTSLVESNTQWPHLWNVTDDQIAGLEKNRQNIKGFANLKIPYFRVRAQIKDNQFRVAFERDVSFVVLAVPIAGAKTK
jgi:hypothetical protein